MNAMTINNDEKNNNNGFICQVKRLCILQLHYKLQHIESKWVYSLFTGR